MEANYKPADATFKPLEVTFNWSEQQDDYSFVERSHTQLISKLPFKYNINVGGADHPIVNALRVNLQGAVADAKYGYSDGKDAGGEKYVRALGDLRKKSRDGQNLHAFDSFGYDMGSGRPGRQKTN